MYIIKYPTKTIIAKTPEECASILLKNGRGIKALFHHSQEITIKELMEKLNK